MKNYLLLMALIISVGACNTDALEPKFQGIEHLMLGELTATKVSISADAVIYNPNQVSIYLNTIELDVFANNLKVSHIIQTKQTEIAKKDNFNIPLALSFNPTELFKDNLMGLLGSALSSLRKEKVVLEFIGYAQFEVKGIKFTVPIKYRDEILLKEE